MLWIFGGLLVVILFLITYSRLYIICNFTYSRSNKGILIIRLYFYRLCLFKRKINLYHTDHGSNWVNMEFLDEFNGFKAGLQRLIQKVKQFNNLSTPLLNNLQFHEFKWHTRIGTGEASTTGIVVGGIWAIKGIIIGLLSERSRLTCMPITVIKPYFQKQHIQSKVDCIVSIRVGQAIYVFFKVIRNIPAKKKAYI